MRLKAPKQNCTEKNIASYVHLQVFRHFEHASHTTYNLFSLSYRPIHPAAFMSHHQIALVRIHSPLKTTPTKRPDRHQVVQYIDLIRQDPASPTATPAFGASWATSNGGRFPWLPAHDFGEDVPGGHGTHTAGSAAGVTISSPATTEVCGKGKELSCVGGCVDTKNADGEDDLLPDWEDVYLFAPHEAVDLDRLCPRYDCDGLEEEYCLGDDEGSTLAAHGGIARGAKLAIFDILDEYYGIGVEMAGNGIWEPAMEAGSRLHSNSWGSSQYCEYLPSDVLRDNFMYTVRAKSDSYSEERDHRRCAGARVL